MWPLKKSLVTFNCLDGAIEDNVFINPCTLQYQQILLQALVLQVIIPYRLNNDVSNKVTAFFFLENHLIFPRKFFHITHLFIKVNQSVQFFKELSKHILEVGENKSPMCCGVMIISFQLSHDAKLRKLSGILVHNLVVQFIFPFAFSRPLRLKS